MSDSVIQEKLQAASSFFEDCWCKYTYEPLFLLCANGLHEVRRSFEHYAEYSRHSRGFLVEVEEIAHTIFEQTVNIKKDDVQAIAFRLFESLAIIMKEVHLSAEEYLPEPCAAIHEYFEQSGNWTRQDKTLASEMYYEIIPAEKTRVH